MVRTGLVLWLCSSAPVSVLLGRMIAGPAVPDVSRAVPGRAAAPQVPVAVR